MRYRELESGMLKISPSIILKYRIELLRRTITQYLRSALSILRMVIRQSCRDLDPLMICENCLSFRQHLDQAARYVYRPLRAKQSRRSARFPLCRKVLCSYYYTPKDIDCRMHLSRKKLNTINLPTPLGRKIGALQFLASDSGTNRG